MFIPNYSPNRFPFFPSSPPKSPPSTLARPFEDALATRLATLLSLLQSSCLPLSWLSSALHLLSLTLSDAASLLADVSSSDRDTVAAHLDSSVSLLDACNVASAEVDRLLLRRLNLCLALHILSSESGRTPEKLKRARDSLAQWRASPRRSIKPDAQDLVRSLAPADAPRGRLSAVRRAIYAVEVVSKLIVGAAVAVLGGGGGTLSVAPVPADLPWAKEYKGLAAAVSSKLIGDGFAVELEAAEVAAANLTVVMDQIVQNVDGGNGETLRNAVDETEKATGVLSKGLDDLSSAVNELFHSALGLRNTALQGFRVGTQRCNHANSYETRGDMKKKKEDLNYR